MSISSRPVIALLLSLLALYIGLAVIITGLAAEQTAPLVLYVGVSIALAGAVAVPAEGYLVLRSTLREQRICVERELYAVVREHLVHDAQFTAPPEAPTPTVVDFARRTVGKDNMT